MSVTIYHNPRCSKSRQTLKLLEDKGLEPTVILYLETPPSPDELLEILIMMDKGARDIIRKGEAPYKELELNDPSLDDDALVQAMCGNPVLIERPIVVNDDKAAIGRPPESVLDIL